MESFEPTKKRSTQNIPTTLARESIKQWARETFAIEQRVLSEIAHDLDDSFCIAVEKIRLMTSAGTGRVIISGIGKSGLVARKWVATFSGTGTSAFFINPVEAAHGDLGALRPDDLLILLSYSGETEELAHMLRFAREQSNFVIAVTSSAQSTLARSANLALTLNISQEACPLGLAPTASTTAMMALGDALAMCLMRLSGFTADAFARVHPGGTLGRRLFLKVKDLMHSGDRLPVVGLNATMEEVIIEMTRRKLGATLVMDGDNLAGIVTDGDLRRFLQKKIPVDTGRVTDVMSGHPRTIRATDPALEAYLQMKQYEITHLVVLDEHAAAVGLIHIHDLSKAKVI